MKRTDLVISADLLAMPVIVMVAAFARGITGVGSALVTAPLLSPGHSGSRGAVSLPYRLPLIAQPATKDKSSEAAHRAGRRV